MADDAIKEMISAFALGCMDKPNYKQFREYLENNGKLPKGELGDLQNIIALIPTILDIESPNEELKNELGKRLIEIQKDIKNKVVENRRETRIKGTADFVQRNSSTKMFDVGEKRIQTPNTEIDAEKQRQSSLKTYPNKENNKLLNTTSAPTKPVKSSKSIFIWLFSIILLGAIAFMYYSFSTKISVLDEQNIEMGKKITKLRSEITRTDEFINQNMEFVEFFNNPGVEIISLTGIATNSKENGKLYISFSTGQGFLQLQNMPHLDAEMTFQLWLLSKNGSFSLGTFELRPDKKYMKIHEIVFPKISNIEMFILTKEKKENVTIPTGETILAGTIKN